MPAFFHDEGNMSVGGRAKQMSRRVKRRTRKAWEEARLRSLGKLTHWGALSAEQREYIIDQMSRRPARRVLTPEVASAWAAEARALTAMRPGSVSAVRFVSSFETPLWVVTGMDQHGNVVTEMIEDATWTAPP